MSNLESLISVLCDIGHDNLDNNQFVFRTSSSAMCPLCSEQNWSQFENDMWRLEHWIQSTEAKLSVQPMVPPSKIEQLEDVIQEHRVRVVYNRI